MLTRKMCIRDRPMTVAVRNLPPELEGFKVAQITDLHASNLFPAARTEAVVKAVNEARPDLVLITGCLLYTSRCV